MNRDKAIDALRGIAILLVILGHCVQNIESPINKVILSFHMPLFFFCSGMLARGGNDYAKFVIHKFRVLMLPQLFVAIMEAVYAIFIDVIVLKNSKISDLSPLGWLTSWFLIVLLYVSIIYPLILKVFHLVTNRSLCIIILIEAILALLSSHFLTSTYLSLEKIPVAILFYTIGYVFKEKNLKVYLLRIVDKLWMLVLPLLVLFATVNKPVCMYLNDYGNFFIFVVTSILGITICFWIAEYFKMNEVLNVFGRNSIILYSTHFFVVKIFRLVINFMLVDPFTTIDYPYYFLLFLCVIISEIIILKVWNILKIMMQKKLD